ncbi:MAG: hypothetical protein H6581_07765 [Bacteroidia bacterium]|nr:hypothetical protein [Bacteroidia bacterium]
MSNEELIQLSDTLKAEGDLRATYFSLAKDEDQKHMYLRANRRGLIYAAAQMLYAAGVLEDGQSDGPQRCVYTFDWEELSEESEFSIEHVELVDDTGEVLIHKEVEITMKDRLIGWGSMAVVIGMLVALIIGIATIIHWFV